MLFKILKISRNWNGFNCDVFVRKYIVETEDINLHVKALICILKRNYDVKIELMNTVEDAQKRININYE